MPDPAAYNWIGSVLGDAACVTVVTGRSVAEVLRIFGADPSRTLEGDDTYGGGASYPASVAAAEVAGGVVAVEFNGYQGSLREMLVQLSEDDAAASIYWNVNDDNAFTCARHGRVVATLDMYDAEDDSDDVDLPEALAGVYAVAREDDADLWAVGLAMVEAFTGVSVPRQAVESITSTHPISASPRPPVSSADDPNPPNNIVIQELAFVIEDVLPQSAAMPGDATIVCRKIAGGDAAVGDELFLALTDGSVAHVRIVDFPDIGLDGDQLSAISLVGAPANNIQVGGLAMQ